MTVRMTQYAVGVLVALPALALAAGCAPMKVNSFAERGVNVGQFRTYAWAPPDTWTTGDPRLDSNRFFDERVRAQVEKQLAQRGFEKTTSQAADMLVHYHASVSQEIDVRNLDPNSAYCKENECRPFIHDKGTLLVDLVEGRADKLIWRGWAEGSLDGVVDNQAWMESRIDEAILKILTRLPRRL